jgi:hypothetical protein
LARVVGYFENGSPLVVRSPAMEREYDIFEKVEGHEIWRCSVVGHDAAIAKLKELAAKSPNEFVVMYLPGSTVIATLKTPAT